MNLKAIQIQLARREDADAIARMSRDFVEYGLSWRWHKHRVLHAIGNPDTNCAITTDGDQLTGFAIALFAQHQAHIALLAVHPDYQRKGIGQQLVRWQELSATTAGINRLSLEVRRGNHAAIRFYEQLGYVTDGVISGYYENKEDALKMVHLL